MDWVQSIGTEGLASPGDPVLAVFPWSLQKSVRHFRAIAVSIGLSNEQISTSRRTFRLLNEYPTLLKPSTSESSSVSLRSRHFFCRHFSFVSALPSGNVRSQTAFVCDCSLEAIFALARTFRVVASYNAVSQHPAGSNGLECIRPMVAVPVFAGYRF